MPAKYIIPCLFILGMAACNEDNTAPGEVADLLARGGDEEVSLSWTEPMDEDLISIHIIEVGADKIYAQASGFNGITITGLTNGTDYEFAVVTVDKNGNQSDAVKISATPAIPFVLVDPDKDDYEPSIYVQYSDGYQTITPSATFELDTAGHVQITVVFDRPADRASLLPGQTIYFEGADISSGNIIISEDNLSLTLMSTEIFSSFGEVSESASYMIYTFDFVLVGDDAGAGVVRDSDGIPLDGDEDGFSGGDFVLELTVFDQIL